MSKKLSETKLKLSKEFLNISRQKIKALPIEKRKDPDGPRS